MAMKIGTLEVDLTADSGGLDAAEQEVRKAAKGTETAWQRTSDKVTAQFKRIGAASRKAANDLQFTRHHAQQAAFQIQDFTAQVSGGTNALQAFSLQAPQFLGAFGPGGAIVGAVVGVASAIGASLIPALFDASKESDKLKEATDKLDDVLTETAEGGVTVLTEKIVELAAESKEAALVQIKAGLVASLGAVGEAAKNATELLDEVLGPEFGRRMERGIEGFDLAEVRIREMARAFGITFAEADRLFDLVGQFRDDGSVENLEALQQQINEIAVTSPKAKSELASFAAALSVSTDGARTASDNVGVLTAAQDDLATAVDTATEALTREERALAARRKRVEELRKERAEAADMQRRERGITGIERLGESSLDRISREAEERREFILQQDQLTADARANLLEIVQADREAKIKQHNDRLAAAEQAAGQRQAAVAAAQQTAALTGLATLADSANQILVEAGQDGTAISKAIFLAQKAIQVASIIAATEVAAANASAVAALGGPFAWLSTQSGIRTVGYANAALVAGLAVGQTFGGGRQFGGSVSAQMAHPINEGGVPEILTQSGRQFLLPTGRTGDISPLRGGAGTGPPNITLVNNGTPQAITGTQVSRDEIAIMIDDRVSGSERRQNASLATGRGDMASSLRRGFQVQRRL